MTATRKSKELAPAAPAVPAAPARRRLYTIPDACHDLSLSRSTILKLIANGQLETIRLSERAVRIPATSIDRLLGL